MEASDFKSIMIFLNSTSRRDANVGTAKSAKHKLKWTVRCASGIFIPDMDGPDTKAKKEEALKAGIQKIRTFGKGTGYFYEDGSEQERNEGFLSEFNSLSRDKEVK